MVREFAVRTLPLFNPLFAILIAATAQGAVAKPGASRVAAAEKQFAAEK